MLYIFRLSLRVSHNITPNGLDRKVKNQTPFSPSHSRAIMAWIGYECQIIGFEKLLYTDPSTLLQKANMLISQSFKPFLHCYCTVPYQWIYRIHREILWSKITVNSGDFNVFRYCLKYIKWIVCHPSKNKFQQLTAQHTHHHTQHTFMDIHTHPHSHTLHTLVLIVVGK